MISYQLRGICFCRIHSYGQSSKNLFWPSPGSGFFTALLSRGPTPNFCLSWGTAQHRKTCLFVFFLFKEASDFCKTNFGDIKLIRQILQISLTHRLDKWVSSQAGRIIFSQDTPRRYRWGDRTLPRRRPTVKSGGPWKNFRTQQEAWAPRPLIRKENLLLANLEPFKSMNFSQSSPYSPFPMHESSTHPVARYFCPRRQGNDNSALTESSKVGTVWDFVFQTHCWPPESMTPPS